MFYSVKERIRERFEISGRSEKGGEWEIEIRVEIVKNKRPKINLERVPFSSRAQEAIMLEPNSAFRNLNDFMFAQLIRHDMVTPHFERIQRFWHFFLYLKSIVLIFLVIQK